MIGKKAARKIVDFVCQESKADQTEVVIFNYNQALTRFANNYIHQNVNESNSNITIRVIKGKKIGSASTNALDFQKIKDTIKWAEQSADFQRADPDFISLSKVKSNTYRRIKTYYKNTAEFSNTERANAVTCVVGVAKKYGLITFGAVSNGAAEVCIGNSLKTFAHAMCSDIFCSIVMSANNSTGYVRFRTKDVTEMDYKKLAEVAVQKALMSADPVKIPPGHYTTIFEPLAASEFLEFLGYYAFNGKIFNEGRSYLSERLGSKIVDKRITIIDDPFNNKGFNFSFDFEGVPKRRLVLVDRGVAKSVVYDSLTAARVNKKTTGHALSAPNSFGPIPMNMCMKAGDVSLDKMIKDTKKGILVTRFHYTNIVDPHKLIITGMTRDGTFLIEDGKITKGLKNLRFTDNVIEVLNRVDAISKNVMLVGSEPGYGGRFGHGTVCPALKIRDFNFTSATEF